jgi:predicted RNA-binding protein YlqC (UPF0109 family)
MYIACMKTFLPSDRCVYCGCSETSACVLGDGITCSWIEAPFPVCSKRICVHLFSVWAFSTASNAVPFEYQVYPLAARSALLWLYVTVWSLVDDPAAVRISMSDHIGLNGTVIGVHFSVDVPASDVGKVIGMKGGHARKLRALMSARAVREKTTYSVSINDNSIEPQAEKEESNG